MSKLLYDEPPIVIQPSAALTFGVVGAAVLQQIHYISLVSKTGCVAISASRLREWFPVWSDQTIKRALRELVDSGALAKSSAPGETGRYRVCYEKLPKPAERDGRNRVKNDPVGGKNRVKNEQDRVIRDPDRVKGDPVLQLPLYTEEKEIREEKREREPRPRSLEDVVLRFAEIGLDRREAEKFWSHGETIGWKVGKAGHPMKDWRAASITWKLRKEEDDAKRTNGSGRRSTAGGSTRANDLRESLDGALALSRRRGPHGPDPRDRG